MFLPTPVYDHENTAAGHAANEHSKILSAQDQLIGLICDSCGASMLDLHCKLRCLRCGFFRDCSDP